ncbi:Ion channel [Aphelenchoides fujianensis]|nr:Ion channel [Aphelenchoides fujianensis]
MLLPRLVETRKSFLKNLLCLLLLVLYALFGGFMFLHFEADEFHRANRRRAHDTYECVNAVIKSQPYDVALEIIEGCVEEPAVVEWNLRNSLLYGFGILTTLGYGKIATQTAGGKLFTVAYGFVGVPITVIILTNFGLYLRQLEKSVRKFCTRAWRNQRRRSEDKASLRFSTVSGGGEQKRDRVSPFFLAVVVFLYLLFGAVVIPLLDGHFDFVNGLYNSYICFTAIEFGSLIPNDPTFIPIVIIYMMVGLCISTLAVELGSVYVKKIYFYGRSATNFANVKIWFGSKQLQVTELLSALSQTVGIDPDTFSELDLEQLVKDAILVKEGKLDRIPQNYRFLEGIWPPSLVPLFLRDGAGFPEFVDADERIETMHKKKMTSLVSFPLRLAGHSAYHPTYEGETDSDDEEVEEINNNALKSLT